MVLVNTLTIEAINTALIALQRGKDIVVGGEKGTTINNITISNSGSGGGSGSSLDFSPQVDALDKRIGLLEKAEELLRIENEKQSERIAVLEGLGIENVQFDDTSRTLSIELVNGETFETDITSETLSMRLEGNELVIKFGESEQRLPLPVGTQADWEQTDPDAPDYIKNKIPIWIEDGPASDNMAPVDSVTAGEMRPVTSNAVAQEGYLTSADITDQVTVNNMQSVSSNAVARALEYSEYEDTTNTITIKKWGRFVWVSKSGFITGGINPFTINNAIPSQYLPTTEVRTTWINNTSDKPMGQAIIRTDGRMQIYAGGETSFSNVPAICQFCYIV